MFKEHPKGLFVAFFTNMGERFGFYTMYAIFVLFIQAKYGFDAAVSGQVWSIFLVAVYFLPLLGGILADRVLGYGRTISIGIVVMFIGYLMLALPTTMGAGLPLIFAALAVIAIGTGLFKGNLQALVGSLYDDPRYSAQRDRAFNIFYMGINIGAMFAPTAAEAILNWILRGSHYFYDARIPALANAFLKGNLADAAGYLQIAQAQDPSVTLGTLNSFSQSYINAMSKGYHFSFGVACISLILSMLVFWIFRRHYRHVDLTERQKAKSQDLKGTVVTLTPQQTKARLVALGLVFVVVIFFWMSFHQNGLTQTWFARDYTVHQVGRVTNLWFDLFALLPIFLAALGLVFLVKKSSTANQRLLGALAFFGFGLLAWQRFRGYGDINPFTPQKFQHFNPFFIVALTPLVIGFFSYLNRKGREPSAPRKIGFGMLLTAVAFSIMIFASVGLASPRALQGQVAPEGMLVSPYWLISSYFLLTIAELLLSPMGISFVSRVSPPKYKGMMQGGWFAATAAGNYLVGVMGALWLRVPLWALWAILVCCCLLSAAFIFSIMKRLERATKDA